jgi:hypothetical protein
MPDKSTNTLLIEAANRAEVTALLIRCGYRVYRPEADVGGEDLIVRTPKGKLWPTQRKGRAIVDRARYGGKSLHMLFPDSKFDPAKPRQWFLAPHDELYDWVKKDSPSGLPAERRSYPQFTAKLRKFLEKWMVEPPAEPEPDNT